MVVKISSTKNDLIKDIINLQAKSRERKTRNVTLIEGHKEISVAVSAGIEFEKVLFHSGIISEEDVRNLISKSGVNAQLYELNAEVFSKISYRETTGGVVILAKTVNHKLEDFDIKPNSLFIVLESVEKPGNLGAVCRIADAAKVAGVIIADPLTDIYNPNTVRASLGCVFNVKVVSAGYDEVFSWLKLNNVKSFAAELTAAEFYHKCDLTGKVALVFGTEATGLTSKWINYSDQRIKIPMLGEIDSLNVSTSVAVMVFESMRQRGFLV